jgi:CheY-like chemotaxis protein
MLRVLVYFDSPSIRKMLVFAASRVGTQIEVVEVGDHARALSLLEHGPWHLAVIGFVPSEAVVEAYARAGVPTLVGVCVDTPELEPVARQRGATRCWRWPMQAHLMIAMIREQLATAASEPGAP